LSIINVIHPEHVSYKKNMSAKTVLDIGVITDTGSISLAAALVVRQGGTVFALEKSRKYIESPKFVNYSKTLGLEDKL